MVSSSTAEIIYSGNNSTVTSYSVPFLWLDETHVKAQKIAAGTGTVSVASGVATFTSAQSTLGIGSHIRISGTTYTVHEKTSTTVFTLTEEVTVASSSFHILEDVTQLVEGSTFTLTGTSGSASITTDPAIAATALLRIYREVPFVQLTALPNSGPYLPSVLEAALDYQMMAIQRLYTMIQNAGIIAPSGAVSANDTTTFANTAARAAATPSRIGQIGVQLDTNRTYYGTATTAGSWQYIADAEAGKTYSTSAALTAAAPDYVGQIAKTTTGTFAAKSARVLYIGTGTSAGNWSVWGPNTTKSQISRTPWGPGETLVAGQRRWLGYFGRTGWIDEITFGASKIGSGNLEFRILINGVEATTGNCVLTPTEVASHAASGALEDVAATFKEGSTGVTSPFHKIEVIIESTGDEIEIDTVAGSSVTTPVNPTDIENLPTGSVITTPTHGDNVVVFIRSDGTLQFSHPTPTTDTVAITTSGKVMTRGIVGTFSSGTRTITATTTDKNLIKIGDTVIGPTVEEGTVVTDIATDITISKPLKADTTLISFINENRPSVLHYISSAGNLATTGATDITLPTTVGIKVGDTAVGTNVAADTFVNNVASTEITLSDAITGNITNITITPPVREATATAGDFTMTLDDTTGMKIGRKVVGPFIADETYVESWTGLDVTLDKEITGNLTANDVQFTRDVIKVEGTITTSSTTMTLPYAVSDTDIEEGYAITAVDGDGLSADVTVDSINGSQITMSAAALKNAAGAKFLFSPTPIRRWKGLDITISGPFNQFDF